MTINLEKEFPLDTQLCYLNHAAVSPWPLRTAKAIEDFAWENIHYGARDYGKWETQEIILREQLRTLINASSIDDIALVKNTSEGLSMVAYGLEWQAGDEIVISDQEFPSNRIVWESLAGKGVKVIEVSLDNHTEIEKHIASHFTQHTRLLAISSVQYASGLKLDLKKLGALCKNYIHSNQPILFCVDAIQSLGAYPLDAQAIQADFVIADGHKWLMAPEGLGLFYSHRDLRQNMRVNEFGWRMIKDPGDYLRKEWQVASSARRFECGSPNMLGIHGLSASLSLILEYGIVNIERDLNEISNYLRKQLQCIKGCKVFIPEMTSQRSAIINFQIEGKDSEELKHQLMEKEVVCAHRGKGVRFSPHFYISKRVIDNSIERLASLI